MIAMIMTLLLIQTHGGIRTKMVMDLLEQNLKAVRNLQALDGQEQKNLCSYCDDTKVTYADNDGDGFGAGSPTPCGVTNNTDCNDNDEDINPDSQWWKDNDGDSYGNPNIRFEGCNPGQDG